MTFRLIKRVINAVPIVDINEDRYNIIKSSWNTILTLVNIEESWENVLNNFVELESDLIRCALNSMVFSHEGYEEFQDNRLGFARRLLNLLRTTRCYLDHVPHNLSELKQKNLVYAFKNLTSVEYDAVFEYRFMEALRNYSQHRGLPIHGTSYHSSWVGDMDDNGDFTKKSKIRYMVTASINVNKLIKDESFKQKVAEELQGLGSDLDVTTCIRRYVEALGRVHMGLRSQLKELIENAVAVLRQAIQDYSGGDRDLVIGLYAEKLSEAGELLESVPIIDALIDRLERLTRRNRGVVNLSRRYITTEIIQPQER